MTIDGVVFCDCLETGIAAAPPCPVVRSEEWFQPAPGYEAHRKAVRAWAQSACPHPEFWLVEHQVLTGALLRSMAAYGGELAFPTIAAALPTHNGGSVSAADSAACIAELDLLAALMARHSMVVIIDVERGTVVFVDPTSSVVATPRHHKPRQAFIGFDHGAITGVTAVPGRPFTSTWLGEDAVVRVLDGHGAVLFAAQEFTQERDGEDWLFRDERVGTTVRHCSPIGHWRGTPEDGTRHLLRAELRPFDIYACLAGVAWLRELFHASVRTGRPVLWC